MIRLLLLGREYTDLEQVSNYSAVYSYFISRALRDAGVEVAFADPRTVADFASLDLAGVDHVIGIRNQYFTKLGPACVKALRGRFAGTISQINDSKIFCPFLDCTFTARDPKGMPGNHYVGWAADPDVCRPAQRDGELMILIDHPDYAEHRQRSDRTADTMRQVRELVASRIWQQRFERVAVAEIRDGEIVESDLADVPKRFTRHHVPFPEAAAAYGRASLFMVTHRESLGLGVLETAMCGALPVVPAGFVASDRLRTVRAIQYSGSIDWPTVLAHIDPPLSREVAMDNSWAVVAGRMLQWFDRAAGARIAA